MKEKPPTIPTSVSKIFMFLTTRELTENGKDLQAPALAGPPRTNLGARTPRQLTLHVTDSHMEVQLVQR